MSWNVGSTGALLVMSLIALWLWRGGERPVRSASIQVALIGMVVGIVLEAFGPFVIARIGSSRNEGCWQFGYVALVAAVHAVALGAFVKFVLSTIARKVETPNG